MEGGSNLWGAGFMNCIVVEVLHCGVGGEYYIVPNRGQ